MLLDSRLPRRAPPNRVDLAFGRLVANRLGLRAIACSPSSFVSMILPALGFLLLGSADPGYAVVATAMFLVGLSVGAEIDLLAFLVARYFKLRIYNSTLGLLICTSFLSSAAGALGVSYTLGVTTALSRSCSVIARLDRRRQLAVPADARLARRREDRLVDQARRAPRCAPALRPASWSSSSARNACDRRGEHRLIPQPWLSAQPAAVDRPNSRSVNRTTSPSVIDSGARAR